MPRISKVQQSDVFDAANRLREEGFNPTVRAIRELIGGATVIVTQHLKEWRKLHPIVEEGAEVDPVTASISELYDRLVEKATEALSEKAAEHDKELEEAAVLLEAEEFVLEEAKQKTESAMNEVRKQQLLIDTLKSELDQANRDAAESQAEKRAQTVELAHFKEKSEDLQWSLKQEQIRVKELEGKIEALGREHAGRLAELTELVQKIDSQSSQRQSPESTNGNQ
ncbi:DNA-binding protein [Marinobacterium lutimaris]|uniref:Replication region DNA-binding N-term n=1 Tax=Marinobacterium lutimaris TaxID=568106 RepID=A0A1H6DV54_9GAMM|nr:DNA-binding protein [Marinobacterium lutimaris]SEG88924.1 replication region DNA-binding N-term [Marinobacterium lutimaris]